MYIGFDASENEGGGIVSTLSIVLFDMEEKCQVVYQPCDFCEGKSLTQK